MERYEVGRQGERRRCEEPGLGGRGSLFSCVRRWWLGLIQFGDKIRQAVWGTPRDADSQP